MVTTSTEKVLLVFKEGKKSLLLTFDCSKDDKRDKDKKNCVKLTRISVEQNNPKKLPLPNCTLVS